MVESMASRDAGPTKNEPAWMHRLDVINLRSIVSRISTSIESDAVGVVDDEIAMRRNETFSRQNANG